MAVLLTGLAGMATADSLYMLVNYPDSAYWMNTNLDIVYSERIPLNSSLHQPANVYAQGIQYEFRTTTDIPYSIISLPIACTQ